MNTKANSTKKQQIVLIDETGNETVFPSLRQAAKHIQVQPSSLLRASKKGNSIKNFKVKGPKNVA